MSREIDRQISVTSAVTPISRDPIVRIEWGDSDGTLSAIDARVRGLALIRASAIAQTEETIFKTLAPDFKPYKGFGEFKPTKDQAMAAAIVTMLRDSHNFKHRDIKPIFGAKHREGLVEYRWGTSDGILTIDDACHHGSALIEAAEAAENDSFFYQFFEENASVDRQLIEGMVGEYRLFKQQKYLQSLLEK